MSVIINYLANLFLLYIKIQILISLEPRVGLFNVRLSIDAKESGKNKGRRR